MERTNVHSLRRSDFAEYAEALGVDTNTIMGAHTEDGGRSWSVCYTPDGFDDSDPVILGRIWVNNEGIMETISTKKIATVGDWKREVDLLMRKALGGDE